MVYKYATNDRLRFYDAVKSYQEKLNSIRMRYHTKWKVLQADGYYGKNTDEVVRRYQSFQQIIPVDGILGPITMRSIDTLYAKLRQIPLKDNVSAPTSTFTTSGSMPKLPSDAVGNAGCKERIKKEEIVIASETVATQKFFADKLHFSIAELCYSDTANRLKIDNSPNDVQKEKLEKLIVDILEPIRKAWGLPLHINSGFRGEKLNKAVGGVSSSQHCKGEAADLSPIPNTPINRRNLFIKILKMINDKDLKVGQLIWEFGSSYAPAWVHVSLPYSRTNDVISIPLNRKNIRKDATSGRILIS